MNTILSYPARTSNKASNSPRNKVAMAEPKASIISTITVSSTKHHTIAIVQTPLLQRDIYHTFLLDSNEH
jgi:hypothetical protein